MFIPRTQETEMLDIALNLIDRARKVQVDEVRSAQDAMLNIHVQWEELQSRLKNRKIDGFEPAVDAMVQLAATTLAMASALQSKIVNQRLRQMSQDEEAGLDAVNEFAASKLSKPRKKKKVGVK